jgi:hypothetical protein
VVKPAPTIQDEVPDIDEETEHTKLRLSQKALAKRLQVSVTSLRQWRSLPDFPAWSGGKDPEGTAWKYKAKSGYVYPISPERLDFLNQDYSTQQ